MLYPRDFELFYHGLKRVATDPFFGLNKSELEELVLYPRDFEFFYHGLKGVATDPFLGLNKSVFEEL